MVAGDVKEAFAESESIRVRGQFNVADEGAMLLSSGYGEDFHEKLFDQLPSLRIAKEYLRRKLAAEREVLARRNERS
ncbi:unnamed protein product [Angiostrongylus costaricensis]|uniref:DUF727 domain-containing protein n=1 Tax=Angiostrongylus costaricensis TaxID=334426 RepID=A0A0R3PJA6_ANGCS|nr:unnamed protein product [Angiostrongylus costaricensis]